MGCVERDERMGKEGDHCDRNATFFRLQSLPEHECVINKEWSRLRSVNFISADYKS